MLCCFVLLSINNLCWVSITRSGSVLNCKANNKPVFHSLTRASCLSNRRISWLASPRHREQGEKWYKCDKQGRWLSLVFSSHVVTLLLNSVGSSGINKVFRRSTVCSPFPGLSARVSVLSGELPPCLKPSKSLREVLAKDALLKHCPKPSKKPSRKSQFVSSK